MKVARERGAARKALVDVDTTLPDPPPEGIEVERPALTLSRKDASRLKLRTEARVARGGRMPNDLPTMPGINALSFTIRYLPGGRKRFLEFVRLAAMNGDPSATAWWMVYADLTPTHRQRASFDDVCTASGVKPAALLAGVVGHGMEAMADMGNLVAAAFHPEVVAAMGKSATNIDSEIGAADRVAFLQARGFVPVPKGAAIHLHANASANAAAAAAVAADPSVPKFSDDIASLSIPKTTVQRQIAEPEPPVIDVEAFRDQPAE